MRMARLLLVMEENILAFAHPTKLYGGQARAVTAPEAEALHLPLQEVLRQHPFRKDAKAQTGEGRAATGMETQADAGAMDSLTVCPAAATVRIQEYARAEEPVRRPVEHLFLRNLLLQLVPALA